MSERPPLDQDQIQQLADAVQSLGDDELLQVLAAQPGGYRGALD